MTLDDVRCLTSGLDHAGKVRVTRAMTAALRRWEHSKWDDGRPVNRQQLYVAVLVAQEVALIVEYHGVGRAAGK